MNITDARARLREVIDAAQRQPVLLERHGEVQAVVIGPALYARMVEALEDADDIRAFDAAMAEEGDNISWEQAKEDLGW